MSKKAPAIPKYYLGENDPQIAQPKLTIRYGNKRISLIRYPGGIPLLRFEEWNPYKFVIDVAVTKDVFGLLWSLMTTKV